MIDNLPFIAKIIIAFFRKDEFIHMSRVCGIAAEYNPFHKGHAYQIQKAREASGCDVVIAVMSGNFVQRGEPACIDKFARAEAACRNGADVVLELPFFAAVQSATGFAHGAVEILKEAGADCISFGSECGNLENLQEIADTPINPDHLRTSLDAGMSFPKAYSLLTSSMRPNDILAVSYLKEIAGSGIEPILVQRTSDYLDETMHEGETASAMAIRTALRNHEDVSSQTPMAGILKDRMIPEWSMYWPYLRTFLLLSDPARMNEMFLFNEGIENHLAGHAKDCSTWEEFLSACVTNRYTAGRIRRTCVQALVQLTRKEYETLSVEDQRTCRVLAFNDTGRQWLKEQRKKETRIAARFADVPVQRRKLEYRSTLAWLSVFPEAERQRVLKEEIAGAHYVR